MIVSSYILFTAIEFAFEQESYSTSEGGEVNVVVTKLGEVNETLCIMVNTLSGTALGMYIIITIQFTD